MGPEHDAFGAEFAAYCDGSACLAVANGTDALEIALRAAGCQAGSALRWSRERRHVRGRRLCLNLRRLRRCRRAQAGDVSPVASRICEFRAVGVVVTHLYACR
jgi:hypothetical protein